MAKNTSILLRDLRMFEHIETQKAELIKELKAGEQSGFVEDFDKQKFLSALHKKYEKPTDEV